MLKAIITNNNNKKVKTITGTTNENGYFWNQFNKYCKNKGYNKIIEGAYIGGVAWQNISTNDILKMEWITGGSK